jgi:hypothetical protein
VHEALEIGRQEAQAQPASRNLVWQLRALASVWAVPLAAGAFWMLLIWAIHWNSPRTLVSFHGLLHAAIAERFLGPASTSFPPENPFYAGQPLAYYWFFQFIAAQFTRLLGLNIFYSLELMILIASGILMASAVFLGRRLYNSTISGLLLGYLIVAGTNPLGWLHLLYNILRGGPAVLKDNANHLWGVVHPLYSLIRYNDVGGLYGPLFNFFLNITSRPAALASLLLMVFLLEWQLRSQRRLAYISLAFMSAVGTAFSPVIGITVAVTLLLSLAVSFFWELRAKGADPESKVRRSALLAAGIAIGVGVLIASPTYYHLLIGPTQRQAQLWSLSLDGFRQILAIALSIMLLVILAFVGLLHSRPDQKLFLGMLIFSAFLLVGFNIAVTLPAGNSSNLFHAAVVLLAVPAAGSIVRVNSMGKTSLVSKRLIAGIFLVFLPTLVLLLAAYVNRAPIQAGFASPTPVRLPENSDLASLYRWAQNETDRNSVFVIDPQERIEFCGNTLEFPAMTNRVIFTEEVSHYMSAPYPDSRVRAEIATRLVTGEEPNDSDRAYLSKLNRPTYIVSYHSDDKTLMSRLQEHYGLPIFHSGTVSVYQWPSKISHDVATGPRAIGMAPSSSPVN